eukprot:CAMPEP_0203667376 /NCGR_PEP_ID=MMETSP0090-20130426/4215_1 /ASSEMBLY_ACC=CAM_ASM_001088 /TAXON_ID=426623 /ORGANISM="Chaetoceros affinis, Strain CCMP159" /LENGTH=735 /DNA_ID=CAMNT_0050531515 /DNA_START=285 /DNA_END=2492 /DNA_ORIENTATION=-
MNDMNTTEQPQDLGNQSNTNATTTNANTNTNNSSSPPVVALAPASPSSYGSARSSTNRPSSAGDQSLSLHSLASSDVNINANPNTNINANANANHPQQAKLRNSGVVLGVELLERRQLDWERKRAQEYSRWKSLSEKQIDASAAAIASATIKGNGNSSGNANANGRTNMNANAKQRSSRSMNHLDQRGTGACSASAAMRGVGVGGLQAFPPQPQDNLSVGVGGGGGGGVPSTVHLSGDGDDVSESLKDETIVTMAAPAQGAVTAQVEKKEMKRVNSFTQFLKTPLKSTQNFKRSISDRFSSDPVQEGQQQQQHHQNDSVASSQNSNNTCTMKPILCGYLRKHGRNGKWQKRYFETDGTSLMYYKNKQRTTILATLDLLHVGKIQLDATDPTGCTFMIEVKGRNYYLCADNVERARDWVISLNRVKEARFEIGGLKLIEPHFENNNGSGDVNDLGRGDNQNVDDVDGEDDPVAARIVMVAARKRLKGLGKDDFSEMERSLDEQNNGSEIGLTRTSMSPRSGSAATGSLPSSNPTSPRHMRAADSNYPSIDLLSTTRAVQNSVRVRWNKRRNAIQNWTRRLSRWAKRLTMIRCIVKDDVVHYNPDLHHHHRQQEESQDSNHTDGGPAPNLPSQNQGGPAFIDLGSPSYPELYSESQIAGRHINFSADMTNISSKESMENSAYHSTKSSAASRSTMRKPSQGNRKLEPIVKEEVSGSSQSSGRVTPNNQADDESSGVV